MLISHRHRFVFIHVQKTGGSAVTRALHQVLDDGEEVAGNKHAKMKAAFELFPETRDYFVMGFVRNPWARLLSWHAMVLRRRDASAEGVYDRAAYERNDFWQRVVRDHPDFESFVLEGTRRVQRLATPQVGYLTAPGRRADFIGRTERLEDDLREGLERAGLVPPASTRRTNQGPETDYRAHYTDAMRERVAEVYARDIEEFGYSF